MADEVVQLHPEAQAFVDSVKSKPIHYQGRPLDRKELHQAIDAGPRKSHAEHKIRPLRIEMLAEGMDLTWGDRDKEYGDPSVNLACAGELKAVLRRYLKRDISPAELEALDQVLTKIGRVVTGSPKRDSYVDMATYAAIAGEVALKVKLSRG